VSAPPSSRQSLQRHTMRVVVAVQLLGALGLAAGGAAGGLLAEHLTGTSAAAGLPLAVLVLGSGISAVVITRVMDRAGRRAGLVLAHLAGALGLPEPTGLFLFAIPEFLGAAAVTLAFLRPDPLRVARAAARVSGTIIGTGQLTPVAGKASLGAILGDRSIRLAVLVLAVTNLTMVGIMAVAPVQLHAHGAGMGMVGLMVSAHIAAMYLPSPVTGWLADALGGRLVAGMGALLLLVLAVVTTAAERRARGRGGIRRPGSASTRMSQALKREGAK
jgi:MFS family permease